MKKQMTNYAINYDYETKKQFEDCCSQEFVLKASLMPDAHSGYVAPIGSVFLTKNVLVPSWVGYDIGCGMIACKFEKNNIIKEVKNNSKKIFEKVNEIIPMGTGNINVHNNISNKTKVEFKKIIEELSKKNHNSEIFKFLKTQAIAHLGSLGSGNHFIELGFEENNDNILWLIIHSGSRGVGHKIATHYMKKASKDENNFEQTNVLKIDSKEGEEYNNILNFGLDFALLNRLEMAYKVKDVLNEILKDDTLNFELWVNKNHNHAIKEGDYYLHRKGATPAKLKERGVIPANMRDGSFLVEGLGNEDYLESSSHGAGRILSRNQAKKNISLSEFKKSMNGIIGKINSETLDEAPQAYKNIFEVMDAQKESVKIIKHIKPLINWKG